jgi:hypothetical protein
MALSTLEHGAESTDREHCGNARLLLFGPPTHGLGFNIHYVSHMVAWAHSGGKVPVLRMRVRTDGAKPVADGSECGSVSAATAEWCRLKISAVG